MKKITKTLCLLSLVPITALVVSPIVVSCGQGWREEIKEKGKIVLPDINALRKYIIGYSDFKYGNLVDNGYIDIDNFLSWTLYYKVFDKKIGDFNKDYQPIFEEWMEKGDSIRLVDNARFYSGTCWSWILRKIGINGSDDINWDLVNKINEYSTKPNYVDASIDIESLLTSTAPADLETLIPWTDVQTKEFIIADFYSGEGSRFSLSWVNGLYYRTPDGELELVSVGSTR